MKYVHSRFSFACRFKHSANYSLPLSVIHDLPVFWICHSFHVALCTANYAGWYKCLFYCNCTIQNMKFWQKNMTRAKEFSYKFVTWEWLKQMWHRMSLFSQRRNYVASQWPGFHFTFDTQKTFLEGPKNSIKTLCHQFLQACGCTQDTREIMLQIKYFAWLSHLIMLGGNHLK